MKPWIPSIILIILLILLVAAIRIYVGGPDGLEVVWKGELSFSDTVVNVLDYAGLPRQEVAKHSESLLWQMEDMGLLPKEAQPKRKHRIKKNSESSTTADSDKSAAHSGTDTASATTSDKSTAHSGADDTASATTSNKSAAHSGADDTASATTSDKSAAHSGTDTASATGAK